MNSLHTPFMPAQVNLKEALQAIERTLIHSTLLACDWNQRKAAIALGVQPTTLSQKIQRLKLRAPAIRPSGPSVQAPSGYSRSEKDLVG